MSFENYGGQFPSNGQQEAPGQVPTPQDGTGAPGQNTDPAAQQPMQFASADGNGGPPPGQGGEQKTTLWYD